MRLLSTFDLLDLWERGARLHPLDRALLILCSSMPDTAPAAIADWPLGHRNRALLELHMAAFGSQLKGWSACLQCTEQMEVEIDVPALLAQHRMTGNDPVRANNRVFRLPTTRDLAEVAHELSPEAATNALVQRCMTNGESIENWNEHDIAVLGDALAGADPLAEIRLSLSCPMCDEEAEETIDLVSFMWSEIEARARRAFWEVHAIASAYGWSEKEILSLSPARRAHYMEMVHA